MIFIASGKEALVKDVDGNEYLDFASGISALNLGHRNDEISLAIKEQMQKYLHPCFQVVMYEPYVQLAKKLAQVTPGDFPKQAMLVNSGAEAVENAVKIARRSTFSLLMWLIIAYTFSSVKSYLSKIGFDNAAKAGKLRSHG